MTSVEIKNLDVELGKRKILDNLSFNLGAGQIAALLGPSGCGKTTLLRAIAGLIQPSAGTIRFDKQLVSLSSLVLPAHKRKIGYVPQEGALFPHLNVAENIAFGIEEKQVDLSRIAMVLEKSKLHEFVSELPQGVNTILGERGASISGGQRQRMGIARALYLGAEVLFFDEATSALDSATEAEINASIQELNDGSLTMIIIAHRESSLSFCDRVIDFTH